MSLYIHIYCTIGCCVKWKLYLVYNTNSILSCFVNALIGSGLTDNLRLCLTQLFVLKLFFNYNALVLVVYNWLVIICLRFAKRWRVSNRTNHNSCLNRLAALAGQPCRAAKLSIVGPLDSSNSWKNTIDSFFSWNLLIFPSNASNT